MLVSVVTPTFNSEKTIIRTLESVASQVGVDLEHIVIDDGSIDLTLALLEKFSVTNPHLIYVSQSNQGAAAARNKGISLARGKYIAFLDSDDYWSPEKLLVQTQFMEDNDVLLSYGDYYKVFSEFDEDINTISVPSSLQYIDLLKCCPIGCLTACYNQQALGKVYMPAVRRGQDWGLWLKITRGGLIARKYPGVLAYYSFSKNSLSKSKIKKMFDVFKIYRIEEKIGLFRSLWFLSIHCFYAFRKSKL